MVYVPKAAACQRSREEGAFCNTPTAAADWVHVCGAGNGVLGAMKLGRGSALVQSFEFPWMNHFGPR